jgi:hypothetical protein
MQSIVGLLIGLCASPAMLAGRAEAGDEKPVIYRANEWTPVGDRTKRDAPEGCIVNYDVDEPGLICPIYIVDEQPPVRVGPICPLGAERTPRTITIRGWPVLPGQPDTGTLVEGTPAYDFWMGFCRDENSCKPGTGEEKPVTREANEPPPVRVGQIFPIGNDCTRQKVILRQIPVVPGQPVSFPVQGESESNLSRLNIFSASTKGGIIVPDLLQERSFDLLVAPLSLKDLLSGKAICVPGVEQPLQCP